jgi:hypothetical protein
VDNNHLIVPRLVGFAVDERACANGGPRFRGSIVFVLRGRRNGNDKK